MKSNLPFILPAVAVAASVCVSSLAADWPQYRGVNYDGASPETILKQWPAGGPRVLWKAPLGESFGSFAVSGGRAFCLVQRPVSGQDQQVAIALEVDSGKELWATPLGKAVHDTSGGNGPRSTPTVEGSRVFLFDGHMVLTCLDAATGAKVWQHDLVAEFGGQVIRWFSAASPIVEQNMVLVHGGGSGQAFLAFNKSDGRVVWTSGNDKPTHATGVPATIQGVRQVVFFAQSGLVSIAPATGKELWRQAYPYVTSTASSPIVSGDIVYCSAGYGVGGGAFQISRDGEKFSVRQLWRKQDAMVNHWTTPVCKDGYLYGIYGFKDFGKAPLKCVELATGREVWSQPGFGSGGATVLVDGCVLVQGDKGPLILVEASPAGYKELARCEPLGGKCWTMAVVSNGRIYARNTKEGICLDATPLRTAAGK